MSKTNFVPVGANIKVVGLGGAGCNAITRMVREQIHGVEFIAMNTDAQQLAITEANRLGCNSENGCAAAWAPAATTK